MCKFITPVWIFGLSCCVAAPAVSADLAVEVSQFKVKAGSIVVAIYDQAQGFPVPEKRLAVQVVATDTQTATAVFRALTPGRYAVVAYQDANGNGKLDKNMFGLPTEAYGFSNDVRGKMGPPSFEAACVNVSIDTKIIVSLR